MLCVTDPCGAPSLSSLKLGVQDRSDRKPEQRGQLESGWGQLHEGTEEQTPSAHGLHVAPSSHYIHTELAARQTLKLRLLSFSDTFRLTSGRIICFHLHFIGPDFIMWSLLVAREAGKCSLCVGWEVLS